MTRHNRSYEHRCRSYVPGTSNTTFYLFWKKYCRARPQLTTLSTGRPTVSLRDMLQVTLLLCQARPADGGTGRVCGRCGTAVVVAPGTSSSVGSVLGSRDVEV